MRKSLKREYNNADRLYWTWNDCWNSKMWKGIKLVAPSSRKYVKRRTHKKIRRMKIDAA